MCIGWFNVYEKGTFIVAPYEWYCKSVNLKNWGAEKKQCMLSRVHLRANIIITWMKRCILAFAPNCSKIAESLYDATKRMGGWWMSKCNVTITFVLVTVTQYTINAPMKSSALRPMAQMNQLPNISSSVFQLYIYILGCIKLNKKKKISKPWSVWVCILFQYTKK